MNENDLRKDDMNSLDILNIISKKNY